MTVPYRSTQAPWVLAVICLVGLVGCTPSPPAPVMTAPETPMEATSFPVNTSTAPSSSPPSRTQSPTPSSTLTEEQAAAAATVLEFFRIRNELRKSPAMNSGPLKDLTMGEAQTVELRFLEEDREEGIVQVGDTIYGVTGVGKVTSEDGLKVLSAMVCTDATDTDLVNSEGDSILGSERASFVEWEVTAVGDGSIWRISEVSSGRVEVCSP